jgi:cytochrome c oxidase cbb3-type subunit 3
MLKPAKIMRPALLLIAFSLFAGVHAADDPGARLYASHCAACHGSNGMGGVGVPIALSDFLSQADDGYLRKTIRLGRPGRVMPAFAQLSDAEVDAIVRHVRGWQKAPPIKPPAVGRGDAARGGELYGNYCASCHGAHGEGARGTGVTFSRPRELPILPPALNNSGFLAAASDAMIKSVLMHGRADTPMGPFVNWGLTDKDFDDLVAFIRGFERRPLPAAGKPSAAEPAVLARTSKYGLKETIEKLKIALAGANMRIIRIGPLDEGLAAKGRENPRRVIVDACDFHFLNQALAIDPRVGLFLPCRVTLVEQAGRVQVMTINPKRLSVLFNNDELIELCEKMHEMYVDILEEATL